MKTTRSDYRRVRLLGSNWRAMAESGLAARSSSVGPDSSLSHAQKKQHPAYCFVSTLPGSLPVSLPLSTTSSPLTSTYGTPSAY